MISKFMLYIKKALVGSTVKSEGDLVKYQNFLWSLNRMRHIVVKHRKDYNLTKITTIDDILKIMQQTIDLYKDEEPGTYSKLQSDLKSIKHWVEKNDNIIPAHGFEPKRFYIDTLNFLDHLKIQSYEFRYNRKNFV
jgi:hypothetical protein